jgi:protein-S-isoprenylcysteine O-methyltransferase Ste14
MHSFGEGIALSSQFWAAMLALLLLCCLASFTWGMRSFFLLPARMTLGMKITNVAGTGSALLHFWAIFSARDLSGPLCKIGAATYVFGFGLFWWTVGANRLSPLPACFSPNRHHCLNKRGPYRFVRHPFYCSYLLAWLAGPLATWNLWLLPTLFVLIALYVTAALREESDFAGNPLLARQYREYCNETARFVPNPWKLWTRTWIAARLRPPSPSIGRRMYARLFRRGSDFRQ